MSTLCNEVQLISFGLGELEVLLDRLAATEVITKTGDRPLHIACEKGHARVVGSLLAQGARMDVYRTQDGLDAFSVAVWYRRKEVMGPLVLYKVQQDPGAYTLRQALWNAVEWGGWMKSMMRL